MKEKKKNMENLRKKQEKETRKKDKNNTYKPKTNKAKQERTVDDLINWKKQKQKKINRLRKKSQIETLKKMQKEVPLNKLTKKIVEKSIMNENYFSENVSDRLHNYKDYYDKKRKQLDNYYNKGNKKQKQRRITFGNTDENFLDKNLEMKKEFRDKNRRKSTYLNNMKRLEKEFLFKKGDQDLIYCDIIDYPELERKYKEGLDFAGFKKLGLTPNKIQFQNPYSTKKPKDEKDMFGNEKNPPKNLNDLMNNSNSDENPVYPFNENDTDEENENLPDFKKDENLSKISANSQANFHTNNSNLDSLIGQIKPKTKKRDPNGLSFIEEIPEFLEEEEDGNTEPTYNGVMENFLDPNIGQIPKDTLSQISQMAPIKANEGLTDMSDSGLSLEPKLPDVDMLDTDSMIEFRNMLCDDYEFSEEELRKDPRKWLIYHDLTWRPIWRPPPPKKQLNYVNNHLKKINDYLKL